MFPKEFYIVPEEVFRLGNAHSARLSHVRPVDVNTDKPGHFCIAPTVNMPLDKYKGLLEELALKATRVFQKPGKQA
ncbi:hypothetical protein G8A07_14170 [Roseateles sp. DAIF2]|uniref:hypothetical protein n=1 Tax=Roseateles sp. DAIF2 TaxID=2714952 RepID=UPI0018A30710|nr:hypothetical protein [Roseateles sp. DAIF2]QPF73952.1 hypothetical protein G8A07_14170 [Roseateles sp. DAIF2]